MAVSLINSMTRPFQPEEFQDGYRKAFKEMIAAKVDGQEIEMPKAPAGPTPDLMTALRESVERAMREAEAKVAGPTGTGQRR